ncbi:hypothetical protein PsYK624_169450 [Phanerochaete sordida]|uniref:Uncharacterized protein n=1 Tax=Phanerochaete sordida TaxID=48140 RepID=A0A9P3LMB3_9APHY|nr:hypothetical protein PsYK624_169450 [Phanerochaete sordida]
MAVARKGSPDACAGARDSLRSQTGHRAEARRPRAHDGIADAAAPTPSPVTTSATTTPPPPADPQHC